MILLLFAHLAHTVRHPWSGLQCRMRCARPLRRLAVLLLLLVGAAALWQRRSAGATPDKPEPSWPPFEPTAPTATPRAAAPAAQTWVDSQMKWVAPVDGGCPDGYPIKANDNSGIFHVPGGRFYARTMPERCYATAADALTDGYRQAKA